ncbi:MAG: thiamine-phosphate kinase [Burkholderiaceae bacterium]
MSAALGEFELIARYFTHPVRGPWASQGVGDDCALIDVGERRLAITCDMLIAGRHFFPATDPEWLGHKALAVNLSDLAAAGATPRAFFLALALPAADPAWLSAFSRGLIRLAETHGCALLGGDTTRTPDVNGVAGPLTISITALGELPRAMGLTRSGARPGDDLWLSGTVGDAAAALMQAQGELELGAADALAMRARLDAPTPRVRLGEELRRVASSAVDVSDGLLADLGHILERSGVGAEVKWAAVPRSPSLRRCPEAIQQRCALAGGDDYELLFTAPRARRGAVVAAGEAAAVPLARIGAIVDQGLRVLDESGATIELATRGYDHFV